MQSSDFQSIIIRKMAKRGLNDSEIDAFLRMVSRIDMMNSGYVPLSSTTRPSDEFIYDTELLRDAIPDYEARGKGLLSKSVIIKLNGGRSTSMGGLVPKGTIAAKNGRCYLDIIAGQIEAFRKYWKVDVPLILMNSFFTDPATREIIKSFKFEPITFIQHQVPRLRQDSLIPLGTDSDDDWAPPGHGDIYESIYRSGLLSKLLDAGKRWAFISNLDNLAATLEPWVIGLLDAHGIDFLLEVTDRTRADRKGGTLVLLNGKLDLLEIAQVDPRERDLFQDIDRFKVFNTNNVWINLESLADLLEKKTLTLPLIQNHKSIQGQRIIQLETAMGAAVGAFHQARGLRVGRDRFFPTKKVGDLFLLQSDVCILDQMDRLKANPMRPKSLPLRPRVFFDNDFLDYPHRMCERFEDPATISLVYADSFEVSGPVFFERNVRIEGQVAINANGLNGYRIQRGTVLRNRRYP